MKAWQIVALLALPALVGILIVAVALTSQPPQEREPAGHATQSKPASVAPATAASTSPEPTPMEFTREGVAGEITTAVERPARPGRVQVAVRASGDARWVCILADGRERYVELDRGLRIEEFPGLQDAGFRPPPPQLSRATTSIYRSVAKRALGYDAARGDRIIIILCPRGQWPTLRLHWPGPQAHNEARNSPENP